MLECNLLAEQKGRMISICPCASFGTLQTIASAARTAGKSELRFGLSRNWWHKTLNANELCESRIDAFSRSSTEPQFLVQVTNPQVFVITS
jgi:hypothetical protein